MSIKLTGVFTAICIVIGISSVTIYNSFGAIGANRGMTVLSAANLLSNDSTRLKLEVPHFLSTVEHAKL